MKENKTFELIARWLNIFGKNIDIVEHTDLPLAGKSSSLCGGE
ncbi:hypothetical protein [Thalassotalea sp. PP2-459]|nr:hypothetical protein [Thalassotalea sp. PP2-459]